VEPPSAPPPASRREPVPGLPDPRRRISRETLYGLARRPDGPSPDKVRSLRGVVRAGVEHNSLVLVDPQGQPLAQLMGGPTALLTDGRPVVVTGVFVTGLLTTAQQGRPFEVRTVEPDPGPDDAQHDGPGIRPV
jgi:hypothetical protein